jgi:AcrR family transcriptional regulator
MGRWEAGAPGRLRVAALELYRERGFDATSVADIAARAGVTERTYFRHFADKREVLFLGTERLETIVVEGIRSAPAAAGPLEAALIGVRASSEVMQDLAYSRLRAEVIAANASLQERELLKMASLRAGAAAALRARGVGELTASVAADAAVSAFHLGFVRWIEGREADLASAIDAVAAEQRSVTGG